MIRKELDTTMALCGERSVEGLGRHNLLVRRIRRVLAGIMAYAGGGRGLCPFPNCCKRSIGTASRGVTALEALRPRYIGE